MKLLLSRASNVWNENIEDMKVDTKKYKLSKEDIYSNIANKYVKKIFIEITSFEELMEFQKDYGNIIIQNSDYKDIKEISYL